MKTLVDLIFVSFDNDFVITYVEEIGYCHAITKSKTSIKVYRSFIFCKILK